MKIVNDLPKVTKLRKWESGGCLRLTQGALDLPQIAVCSTFTWGLNDSFPQIIVTGNKSLDFPLRNKESFIHTTKQHSPGVPCPRP